MYHAGPRVLAVDGACGGGAGAGAARRPEPIRIWLGASLAYTIIRGSLPIADDHIDRYIMHYRAEISYRGIYTRRPRGAGGHSVQSRYNAEYVLNL